MVQVVRFTMAFLLISVQAGNATVVKQPTKESIASVVNHALGSRAQVFSGAAPYYLLGDFNGDGNQDLAVLVQIESERESLQAHHVKYIDINPYSKRNGSELDPLTDMGHYCLGVLVLHGASASWRDGSISPPYIFYEMLFFVSTRTQARPCSAW